MDKIKELSKPLPKEDIELRVGSVFSNGFTLLLYKTARADVKRLNEVFGVAWSCSYAYDENKNLTASISVTDENGKIYTRTDVGVPSDFEKEKGLYSDAFKRAGFKWGIGIELYNSPFIYIKWNIQNKKPIDFHPMYLKITDYKVENGKIFLTITYKDEVIYSNIVKKITKKSTAKAKVETKKEEQVKKEEVKPVSKPVTETVSDPIGKDSKYYNEILKFVDDNKLNTTLVRNVIKSHGYERLAQVPESKMKRVLMSLKVRVEGDKNENNK